MIQFSFAYFGVEHYYVTNNKTGDGVIFIGHINNIYAAQIAFDCFSRITSELRDVYMLRLRGYKKQSTKNKRADEYINEWFEDLIEKVRYYPWYDASSIPELEKK